MAVQIARNAAEKTCGGGEGGRENLPAKATRKFTALIVCPCGYAAEREARLHVLCTFLETLHAVK